MTPWYLYLACFAFGLLLAAVLLAALWLTVSHLPGARHPAPWLLASLVVRMAVLLAGFYWVLGDGYWDRLLIALAGFVIARTLILRRVRRRIAEESEGRST